MINNNYNTRLFVGDVKIGKAKGPDGTVLYEIIYAELVDPVAGAPNKITSEVKEKLQLLIDELIESLEINKLDTNQRIKMLQIALQYTLPRLQSMVVRDEVEVDLPLFVE